MIRSIVKYPGRPSEIVEFEARNPSIESMRKFESILCGNVERVIVPEFSEYGESLAFYVNGNAKRIGHMLPNIPLRYPQGNGVYVLFDILAGPVIIAGFDDSRFTIKTINLNDACDIMKKMDKIATSIPQEDFENIYFAIRKDILSADRLEQDIGNI